jgi:WD40 repeat protein
LPDTDQVLNQVAKDINLLDTARDFFHFVTEFFEPISASATHIYHSALELCPTSSTVRKLYYDRCNRIAGVPRVLVGTPDLWDQTISISTGSQYENCAWSPCGRFIAARTSDTVEIRNQLTFELLTILRPTEGSISPTGPLAYSPDGRSLACFSPTAIIIWDIQTGGVLKEDKCVFGSCSLVWSLDGSTIGIIDTASNVHTYEVVSGKTRNPGKLHLGHKGFLFLYQMWAHEASFRAVTIVGVEHEHQQEITIDIFEIGRTLTKFHSFTFTFTFTGDFFSSVDILTFSPATFHFCVNSFSMIRIFGDQDSNCLLEVKSTFGPNCFSPDGSLFAVSNSISVFFWKYTSGCYIPWRELRDMRWEFLSLQISPTLSSMLGHEGDDIKVCHLHDLPTTPQTSHPTVAALVNSRNRIAAARLGESAITLLDIHSQNPPQFVDTGVEITKLTVVGNVLLAVGSGKAVAWLLTEAGLVCGVLGDRRAGHSDSIWTVPCQESKPATFIKGFVAGIDPSHNTFIVFHTESGELLEETPQPRSKLEDLNDELSRERHLHSSNLSRPSASRQSSEVPLLPTCQQGWVGSPGGRYMLWVPVDWRSMWRYGTWHHDFTLMDLYSRKKIFVKF